MIEARVRDEDAMIENGEMEVQDSEGDGDAEFRRGGGDVVDAQVK